MVLIGKRPLGHDHRRNSLRTVTLKVGYVPQLVLNKCSGERQLAACRISSTLMLCYKAKEADQALISWALGLWRLRSLDPA